MRLIDADAIQYQLVYKEKFMQGTGTEELAAWKEDIDALPPVNLERRWIPCSERLPEGMNTVLVTCVREVKHKHKKKNISVKFAWCCSFWEKIGAEKTWTICGINQNDADKFKVVAWMPLPKPYRE